MPELEQAFRRMRRERAAVRFRERGRALGRRLAVLIERRGHDASTFMKAVDVSQGGKGDGKLTPVELERGLRKFVDEQKSLVSSDALREIGCEDLGHSTSAKAVLAQHHREMRDRQRGDVDALIEAENDAILDDSFGVSDATRDNLKGRLKFSGRDVVDLIRFLDPNADGDVTASELDGGLRLSFDAPPEQSFADDAFVLMNKFELSMKRKAQRVVDLFHEVDKDRSGSLSVRELEKALNELCGPSARARAMAKMARRPGREPNPSRCVFSCDPRPSGRSATRPLGRSASCSAAAPRPAPSDASATRRLGRLRDPPPRTLRAPPRGVAATRLLGRSATRLLGLSATRAPRTLRDPPPSDAPRPAPRRRRDPPSSDAPRCALPDRAGGRRRPSATRRRRNV